MTCDHADHVAQRGAMPLSRTAFLGAIGSLAAHMAVSLATPTSAQTWPSRTITAVVPFGPGTSIETTGRLVLEQMSKSLGQPIVVENRAGAGGTTAAASVARAAPDGHTLLLFSTSLSIAHATYPNRPYDTLRDFIPVSTYGVAPQVLVVAPDKNTKSLADLIAAAKAKPGALNYASIGAGSAPHLVAERMGLSAGIKAQNVSFRGPPEAMTETMTGRIDYYWGPLATVLPLVRDGKLRALAVSTRTRAAALPEVATTLELGLKDSDFEIWHGIFAPAGTPAAIVNRLHEENLKALDVPVVKERFAALGVDQLRMAPDAFAAYFRKDVEQMLDLVQKAGIKPN